MPGVAPAAMQRAATRRATIVARLAGTPRAPFRYRDKGNLATIGRNRAVGQVRGVGLHGRLAGRCGSGCT